MTVAVVLGGGNTLQSDVAAYAETGGPVDMVIACNDAGYWYQPGVDVWVSLHPEKFFAWDEKRAMAGIPEPKVKAAHRQPKANVCVQLDLVTDFKFPDQPKSGSSGMFAAKIGLIDMECDHVVLCGVPMQSASAHFFDQKEWNAAEGFRRSWLDIPPEYVARMRSMSGWTRVFCGPPEWNDAISYSRKSGKATKGGTLWTGFSGN